MKNAILIVALLGMPLTAYAQSGGDPGPAKPGAAQPEAKKGPKQDQAEKRAGKGKGDKSRSRMRGPRGKGEPGSMGRGPGRGGKRRGPRGMRAQGAPSLPPGHPPIPSAQTDSQGRSLPKSAELDKRRKKRSERARKRLELLKQHAERSRKKGDEKHAAKLERRARRLEARSARDGDVNKRQAWVKRREQRKLNRVKRLQKKYGKNLKTKAFRNEVRTHGQRAARLSRMKELAEELDNEKLVERVNALIKKEARRHSGAVATLSGGSKPPQSPEKPPSSANTAGKKPPSSANTAGEKK